MAYLTDLTGQSGISSAIPVLGITKDGRVLVPRQKTAQENERRITDLEKRVQELEDQVQILSKRLYGEDSCINNKTAKNSYFTSMFW